MIITVTTPGKPTVVAVSSSDSILGVNPGASVTVSVEQKTASPVITTNLTRSVWGSIAGDITQQLDLVAFIASHTGTTVSLSNGLKFQSGGSIGLGGTITANTTIDGNNLQLSFGSGPSPLNYFLAVASNISIYSFGGIANTFDDGSHTYTIAGSASGQNYVYADTTGMTLAVSSGKNLILANGGSTILQVSSFGVSITPLGQGGATPDLMVTINKSGLLKTQTIPSFTAPVTTVFGRAGAVVAAANDYTFAQIGTKPTTLSGYGITDAYPLTGNPSGFLTSVPAQSFSSLTGKPTSIAGYGITDTLTNTVANADGTLTISPTSGSVVASLALGHANNWTAIQHMGAALPIGQGFPLYVYNTSDETTNYERFNISFSSNVVNLFTEKGGTGVQRSIYINGGQITLGPNATSRLTITNTAQAIGASTFGGSVGTTTEAGQLGINGTFSNSASFNYGLNICPTITQTSTAGYKALYISVFESATGTGSHNLIDVGTNTAANGPVATYTSKFNVNSGGTGTFAGNLSAGVGTFAGAVAVKGVTGSAWLTVLAGVAAAGGAPLKLTPGILLTTTEAGAVETSSSTGHIYYTPVAAGLRYQLDRQMSLGFKRTNVADTAYTVLATDEMVCYGTLTATRAVTLPTTGLVDMQQFIIKDEAGTAGTNPITFVGTIDGATNKAISTNYGNMRIYWKAAASVYFSW